MKDKLLGFYDKLDRRVLPYPVKFLTNPIVILLTFILLIPLIGFAGSVIFVLIVNSYLNVTSVGVSSIVLRLTNLVAEAQEKRAQQDHEAIHAQFAELKQMHLESQNMHKETHEMHLETQRQNQLLQETLVELHQLVKELHEKENKEITVVHNSHFEIAKEHMHDFAEKLAHAFKKHKPKSW